MKKQLGQVEEFQKKFKQESEIEPYLSEMNKCFFRFELMQEENREYLDACEVKDINEIADALADQMYVLLGTINHHGLADTFEEMFQEVHRSNMSKADKDGNPLYQSNGKVLKSGQYTPPDIKGILERRYK